MVPFNYRGPWGALRFAGFTPGVGSEGKFNSLRVAFAIGPRAIDRPAV
jgi:hypothetical protein